MRLPYVKDSGAKDIREQPETLSAYTKVGRVLFALGLLCSFIDKWLPGSGALGAGLFVGGFVLLYLGRKGNDDPADRLKR